MTRHLGIFLTPDALELPTDLLSRDAPGNGQSDGDNGRSGAEAQWSLVCATTRGAGYRQILPWLPTSRLVAFRPWDALPGGRAARRSLVFLLIVDDIIFDYRIGDAEFEAPMG